MMVLGVPFVLFFSSCMKETFVYGEGDGFKFKASADALNDVERLTKGGDSQLIYANGGDSLFLSSEAELNFVDAFTKAAPTANLTEKIGIFGYKYTGSAPTGNADLANDVELSKESNEFWKPAMNLAWPGADKVQFFGYYPKGYSAVSVKSVANGTPVLNFTVPANVADQKELLVAKTGEYSGDAEQIVAMPFRHALTAIQFSAGDDLKPGITIKKISVKGVASKGEVKLSDVTWSNQNTNADYTIDNINFVSAVGGNKTITSGDKTLMLLPQTVPAGAIIEVVMNDEHGDHILKAAVNGQSWNAGDRITYRISSKAITWTYTFGASVTGAAVAHTGGDQAYKVTSFRTNGNGVKQFVPYTIEYSVDGGDNWTMERPAFLTKIEGKQTGTTEETALTAKFTAQEKTLQTSDIILKGREVKNNLDLSNVDVKGNALTNGQSTANCYVIHNPGTYRFPTIYGNAKKNGATNTKAYTSTKTGPNILTKFLKADGTEITKPEIEGIANACLIWQDTKDLISEIKYENNYVSFAVKKETIHNGNAIIAVRNASNEILWSWHIWVTERDLSSVEVTNFQNKTYNFLPVNLGWCGFGNEWYAPREVKTRLKQAGGKTADLTFQSNGEVLNSDYDLKNGNNPYFQWGRKDPMLPGNGIGDTDKTGRV